MGKRSWYRIVDAVGAGPAIIYLYGIIGQDWWGDGNSALDFARDLDSLGGRDIELRVNSEGGDVFEGYAMYAALNRYPGHVTAMVDGLAASAASYLILAADEVVMGQMSMLMIHNAWTIGMGNAAELRAVADRLETVDGQIIDIYDKHSDKSPEEIAAAMAATTWLTAQDAVDWGFADRIDEGLKAAACVSKDAIKYLGQIPEGVGVVDEAPEPIVGDAPDIIDPTVEDAPVEGSAQEPVVDKPQEQPVTRTVAYDSGIYRI